MKRLLILVTVMSFLLCGCSMKRKTVSELAYDRPFGGDHIIYLMEGSEYVPFLALTNDYNGYTLLLRKEALPEDKRISEYASLYSTSEMDLFLNKEYIGLLGDLRIRPTGVIVTTREAMGAAGDSVQTIRRKVFLLSICEVGADERADCGAEGEVLDYFADGKNRIAEKEGNPCGWWTRTPDSYFDSHTYMIGADGEAVSAVSSESYGVRPAFCVRGDLGIELRKDILIGKRVYTVKTQ